jgi:protein SCO1/2
MKRVSVGGAFELTDHDGRPVSNETYRGLYMMIFFGFTHCRKVCPETLGKMSRVLDGLRDAAEAFAPLYITVDPERDNPATMKAFLEAKFPRFTGLTGTPERIGETRTAYRVFAQKAADDEDPEGYAVPHSALVYITDRDGKYLFHFNDGVPEEKVATRLRDLLATE